MKRTSSRDARSMVRWVALFAQRFNAGSFGSADSSSAYGSVRPQGAGQRCRLNCSGAILLLVPLRKDVQQRNLTQSS